MQGFAPELSAGEAEITGHWLGFELAASEAVARITGSAELAAVGRAHLLTWLARRMAHGPGVLVLEDVHWADHESIVLVQHLTELDDIPLLVLALARPSLLERDGGLAGPRGRASRIDLRPLDATACGQLVARC